MMVTSSMLMFEALSDHIAGQMNGVNEPSPFALRIFSGTRPTKAQLQALVTNAGSGYSNDCYYDTTKVAALMTTLTAKEILSMVNQSAVLNVDMAPNRILVPFSAITDSAVSLQDDAPTWGMVMLWARSTSAAFASWQGRTILYFTVGDQNSNADMKIQGGVIPKGSTWKPNDIVLNVSGAIQ